MLSKKDKYLSAAQKFAERGQLEKALLELGKVVLDDPRDTRTWLKMAELHARRGANDEAAEIYSRTGDLYAEQGFTQKAVAVYKNVLKLSPGSVVVHHKLGSIFKRLALASDAVQQFELAAVGFQQTGQFTEAVQALRQAVELQPDNVVLRVNLAESASQARLTDEAVREFGHAADALKAAGRLDEYIRVCERLLFHRPGDVLRNRELAEVYVTRRSERLALPKLQVCLNADARDPETLSLLARALEQLGQAAKAVSVLKELVRAYHEAGREGDRDAAIARGRALGADEFDFHGRVERAPSRGSTKDSTTSSRFSAPIFSPNHLAPWPGLAAASSDARGTRSLLGSSPSSSLESPEDVASALDLVIGRDVEDVSARSVVPPGDLESPGSSADVARILAETAVFVKYELFERAALNVRRIFEIDPLHRDARQLLISILATLGRKTDAASETLILARQLARTSPREAQTLFDSVVVLDPENRDVRISPDSTEGKFEEPTAPLLALSMRGPGDPSLDVLTPGAIDVVTSRPDYLSPEDVTEEMTITPPPASLSEDIGGVEAAIDVVAAGRGRASRQVVAEIRSEDDVPTPILHVSSRARLYEDDGANDPPRRQLENLPASRPPDPDVVTVLDREHVVSGADVTPHAGEDELDADLELMSFFIDQGMFDDVDALMKELEGRFGGHPRIVEMHEELAAARHLVSDVVQVVDVADPDEDDVATAVIRMDYSSDPGEGFRRLGQYDLAIEEYQRLTRDPAREVFALTKMGDCYQSKGTFTEAILRYKRALNCDDVTREETRLLYFQLGTCFERLGDVSEALYFFQKVAKRDPEFHGVSRKIAELIPKMVKRA